jgi:hypothetical protein
MEINTHITISSLKTASKQGDGIYHLTIYEQYIRMDEKLNDTHSHFHPRVNWIGADFGANKGLQRRVSVHVGKILHGFFIRQSSAIVICVSDYQRQSKARFFSDGLCVTGGRTLCSNHSPARR